jgi:hypothetical protein
MKHKKFIGALALAEILFIAVSVISSRGSTDTLMADMVLSNAALVMGYSLARIYELLFWSDSDE